LSPTSAINILPPVLVVAGCELSEMEAILVLIEIFLPLADNNGRLFDQSQFDEIHNTLIDQFGGLTAFSRAPARGLFESGGKTTKDDILIIEVMANSLDRPWWAEFRSTLEARFQQQEILLRASEVAKL
jgi:hypothetical protein